MHFIDLPSYVATLPNYCKRLGRLTGITALAWLALGFTSNPSQHWKMPPPPAKDADCAAVRCDSVIVDPAPVTSQAAASQQFEWQSFFGTLDSHTWSNKVPGSHSSRAIAEPPVGQFDGVAFPHIESGNRPAHAKYKPFTALVAYRSSDKRHQNPLANVRCMGLSPAAVARRASRYERKILALAINYTISASLVKAVIAKESCFNAKAKSPAGALGLMQLMPATASWLKVRDPLDIEQNLTGGIRYLAKLRKQFGSNELALAAYNAGPGAVRHHGGVPPYAETQAYVTSVLQHYRSYVAATRLASARP